MSANKAGLVTYPRMSTALQAKKFIINKIIIQAQRDNISLSNEEKYMLSWTETGDGFVANQDLYDRFHANTSDSAFEDKITSLLSRAYRNDLNDDKSIQQVYQKAYQTLKQEDHYILVMIRRALSLKNSGQWINDKLLLIATGLALFLFPLIMLILVNPSPSMGSLIFGGVFYLVCYFGYPFMLDMADKKTDNSTRFKIILFQVVVAVIVIGVWYIILKNNVISINNNKMDEQSLGVTIFLSSFGISVLPIDVWRKRGLVYFLIDYLKEFRK